MTTIQQTKVLQRKDTTLSDLRSGLYEEESRPLRRLHMTEFMRILDKATVTYSNSLVV